MPGLDVIIIKIQGSGLIPRTLSASDLADVIVSAERSVAAIVKRDYPDLKAEAITLGLTEVRESSALLELTPVSCDVQVEAFVAWTEGIKANDFTELPRESVEAAKVLAKVSRRLRAAIELTARPNGKAYQTTITPDTEITAPEPVFFVGETVIYGEVISVGGATEPRVRLRLPSGNLQVLTIDKHLARLLGQHLYNSVGLSGEATWDAETLEIHDFRVKDVIDYTEGLVSKAVAGLAEIAAPYYKDIEDPVKHFRHPQEED